LHQRQIRRSSVWFAGGAFAPILRRVDKFLKGTLAQDLTPKASRPSRTGVHHPLDIDNLTVLALSSEMG